MSMEEIIRNWKSDDETSGPESPVGRELNEQELLAVVGADDLIICTGKTCGGKSCSVSCSGTCPSTN